MEETRGHLTVVDAGGSIGPSGGRFDVFDHVRLSQSPMTSLVPCLCPKKGPLTGRLAASSITPASTHWANNLRPYLGISNLR